MTLESFYSFILNSRRGNIHCTKLIILCYNNVQLTICTLKQRSLSSSGFRVQLEAKSLGLIYYLLQVCTLKQYLPYPSTLQRLVTAILFVFNECSFFRFHLEMISQSHLFLTSHTQHKSSRSLLSQMANLLYRLICL